PTHLHWLRVPSCLDETIVVTTLMWLATPPPSRARTARDLSIDLGPRTENPGSRIPNPKSRSLPPGQRLEHSRVLTWLVVALGGAYLARYFWQAGDPLSALTLNILNLAFLMIGFL